MREADIVQEICDWAANPELQIDYLREILDRYGSSQKKLLLITKRLLRFYVDSQGHNNFTDECNTIIEASEKRQAEEKL